MTYDILNKYICTVPFSYLEIHGSTVYGCCPSWLSVPYGSSTELEKIWNGEIISKVQQSVLDGSYQYCDKKLCPHLSKLICTGIKTENFIEKEFYSNSHLDGPIRLNFAFDRSCNFECPSCRNEFIMASTDELIYIKKIMQSVSITFGETVKYIYLSGSCDPFASKTFREFLINFDPTLFPKLNNIHIHTNGSLLNEKFWNEIKNVHPYIKTIEISVDSSTKETYEKIRKGGNWDILIQNLKFIESIPTINRKFYDFVVQDTNYKEMLSFYDIINNLPNHKKNKSIVYYGKILNWGTFTDEEFLQKQIWGEHHPMFNDFLIELKKIGFLYNSINNMNDIIEKYNLNPTVNRLI